MKPYKSLLISTLLAAGARAALPGSLALAGAPTASSHSWFHASGFAGGR